MNKFFNNNKNTNSNLYLPLTIVLFILTVLLNASNKLMACAFIYVLVVITANFISELYGKRKTMQALLLCSVASTILLWNSDYYINGVKINILLGSFTALMVSTYCGISVFLKLKSVYNFHIRSFISLIIGSIVDSGIMACVLLSKFSSNKVLSIFAKDIIVKVSYSLTATLFLLLVVYLLGQIKKSRNI